jgi:peptidoglycan-associated lipoprotein
MRYRYLPAIVIIGALAACSTAKKQDSSTAVSTSTPPVTAAPSAPSGPAPDSLEYFDTIIGKTVRFDYDQYILSGEAQSVLRGQAEWLNQNPARSLTVEGHCDERGTREYNLGLGDRRSYAVKSYLVSLGVNAGRVRTISYGKERPVCVASNADCWQQNRRGVSAVQ